MAGLKRIRKFFKKKQAQTLEKATQTAFEHVEENWPVYSGWSRSNNQVVFDDAAATKGMAPVPEEEGEENFFLAEVAANRAEQQAKINDISRERPDKTKIKNPVPYASDVGFEPGKGDRIFEEAARVAKRRVKQDG